VPRRLAAFALLAGACGRLSFGTEPDRDAPRAPADVACPTCNDGLVAYWPFDETDGSVAHDLAGGHDATLGGNAYGFAPGAGVHGGAGAFTYGYALVPWDMPSTVGGTFTVALWAQTDATSRGFDRYFSMFYWDGSDHGALLIDSDASSNGLRCAAYSGGTWVFVEADAVYAPTGWRHVACTYDGATLTAVANAQPVLAKPMAGALTTTAAIPVAIGASVYDTGGTQNEWHGLLDDVRVYNRALSQDELAALATP